MNLDLVAIGAINFDCIFFAKRAVLSNQKQVNLVLSNRRLEFENPYIRISTHLNIRL